MSSSIKIVNSVETLKRMLDRLARTNAKPAPTDRPSLYIDIEGVHLGRHGSVAILSLYFLPDSITYLVDVQTLGQSAFSTKNREEYSLKCILEFPGIPKVFFDVRNDSDALFHLYGISLGGVQDLQLMELAANVSGSIPAERVSGLARCVKRDLPVANEAKTEWLQCKEEGTQLFDPSKDGSYEIFTKRPLDPRIVVYSSQDVAILPALWDIYAAKVSQTPGYDGQAPGKRAGPWDGELVRNASEDWNDDVTIFGINCGDKLEELSFGIFQWQ
ncbi:Ribonuclease H-like protein [Cordyceps javanica]|uniref:Ribonuclease H-like protein n=1 Tax=Cordyceps javanica TaxID=43265 RepID=A0A545UL55_9HYPO|nr:Ribonuclease H-like protein [Cordyceps javanica]